MTKLAAQHMRRPQMHLTHAIPLGHMVDEAIEFIRRNEPPEGYFVAFSGGKDSIVTLELTRMAGVRHQAYYSATGIDPPEVVRFIREHYPDVRWLRPRMSFWEGIYKNAPPLRMQRWCCNVLKKDPAQKIPLNHRLLGIRFEESYGRSQRPQIDYHKKYKQYLYKPIFYWKSWNVWDFIESNGIPYPVLYDEGFERIGCVICPYLPSKKMNRIKSHMDRWPKMYRTFEHAVTRWFNDKILDEERPERTSQAYIEGWYRGFE